MSTATLPLVVRPRPVLRSLASLLAAGCVLIGGGCATDGRDLAATQPWQTTTTRPPPPTSAPPQESSQTGLTVGSPDFEPGGAMPVSATCAGGNTFPSLEWSGVPPLAVELVVTLADQTDPDEPQLLWLLAGITPDLDGLQAGIIPVGAFESLNGFDSPGFGTPCIENLGLENPGGADLGGTDLGIQASATVTRDLQFRLYVLPQPSGIAPGEAGNQAWDRVRRVATDSASVLARIETAP